MENAHLWAQPLILMTAFIFFWREAKGSRRELNEYIQKELNKIDARFNRFVDNIWERFEKVDAEFDKVDSKFDKVDARFDRFENKMRKYLGEMDKRIARLEDKVDARFDRLERILLEQGK